jgi:uncharacterized protein (DUF983 family)
MFTAVTSAQVFPLGRVTTGVRAEMIAARSADVSAAFPVTGVGVTVIAILLFLFLLFIGKEFPLLLVPMPLILRRY